MTRSYPTLKHAPIVEGMLSITIEPVGGNCLPVLERLALALPNYPSVSPALALGGPSPQGGSAPRVVDSVVGYRFSSEAKNRVFQARLDAFVFSLLAPYTQFTDLEHEARQLWTIYRDAIGNAQIKRIGLRYINRLELPIADDFFEYLNTAPEIARTLPQGLDDFVMRLVIPDTESMCVANVHQVMEGLNPNGDATVIFFDIDAYQIVNETVDTSKLWEIVAELREYKNRIFFDSITDKLRRVYE